MRTRPLVLSAALLISAGCGVMEERCGGVGTPGAFCKRPLGNDQIESVKDVQGHDLLGCYCAPGGKLTVAPECCTGEAERARLFPMGVCPEGSLPAYPVCFNR